jgi:hypothetical protein
MRRRHGQAPGSQPGCCQLVAIAFAVLVASQVLVLLVRLLHEVVVLSATLVRWIGIGLAGAAGLAALVALVFGAGHGVRWIGRRLSGWMRRLRTRRAQSHSYARQAGEWRGGIAKTVGRLRKRGWLSREDARRYRKVADSSVNRVRALEEDLQTLRSVPASEQWEGEVEGAARKIVDHLERTHQGLVRLLAESAVQRAPAVEESLKEATDDLESLLAALEDLEAESSVSEAVAEADEASEARERVRAALRSTQDA